jgi:hypothetical protein
MDGDQNQKQTEAAFIALRRALQPWLELNHSLNIAMGGDSHSGEWSIVQKEDEWLVFVGERGERINVAAFSNPWDAVSYAGYRATAGLKPFTPFPVLYPVLEL